MALAATEGARRYSLSSIIFRNYGNHFGLDPVFRILRPQESRVAFARFAVKEPGYGS